MINKMLSNLIHKRSSLHLFITMISVIMILLLICVSVYAVKIFTKDDLPKMQRRVRQVRLIKPPPPPRVKEKPPEPVIKKKEEIIEQQLEETPPEQLQDQAQDQAPSDDLLGLDADGVAGSDSFGLAAKKGGRSIILGDSHNISPLVKYAWYTRIIEDEIKKRLANFKNLPDDNLHVLVKIVLDKQGSIIDHSIYNTSGNEKLDEAVNLAIEETRMISEPPPAGMPRALKLRISISG